MPRGVARGYASPPQAPHPRMGGRFACLQGRNRRKLKRKSPLVTRMGGGPMALTPKPKMAEKSLAAQPRRGGLSQPWATPRVEGTAVWASSPERACSNRPLLSPDGPAPSGLRRSKGWCRLTPARLGRPFEARNTRSRSGAKSCKPREPSATVARPEAERRSALQKIERYEGRKEASKHDDRNDGSTGL